MAAKYPIEAPTIPNLARVENETTKQITRETILEPKLKTYLRWLASILPETVRSGAEIKNAVIKTQNEGTESRYLNPKIREINSSEKIMHISQIGTAIMKTARVHSAQDRRTQRRLQAFCTK